MKINLLEDRLAMWIVCHAIEDNRKYVGKFNNKNNGVHDICLTVDGVELDFLKVINRIDEIFDEMVEKRAGKMYLEKYDRRSDEITEELENIAERLKEIRRTKFPEINWGYD